MVTDTRELARAERAGQLATDAPANPWAEVGLLTPHGGEQRPRRIESIATISAGYRDQSGLPVISRDGTIYVQDDPINPATGLREALAERGNKALTIAFSSNDPKQIIQQRLTTYSKTRLEAWGDREQITLINLRASGRKDSRGNAIMEPVREVIRRETDPERYATQAALMKAETFVYFFLARWLPSGDPEIYLPDGFASYRLRFTSLNSAQSIVNQLYFISEKTGGQVAGIPLDLFITYRELADPSGVKRKVPIWTLVLRPPEHLQLNTAAAVRGILTKGIEQARTLSLPAPTMLTDEQLALEGPDVDLDDPRVIDGQFTITSDDARKLRGGGPVANPERFITEYFMVVGKTSLREDEGRADFIRHMTGGRTDSLSEFAHTATHEEASRLLEAAGKRAIEEVEARAEPPAPQPAPAHLTPEQAKRLAATRRLLELDDDEPNGRPTPASRPQTAVAVTPEVHQAAVLTGAPMPAASAPARPEHGAEYTPEQWRGFYRTWAGQLRQRDSGYVVWAENQVKRASVAQLMEEVMSCIGQCDSIDEALYLADLDDARASDEHDGAAF
jgi:hypothetical protein